MRGESTTDAERDLEEARQVRGALRVGQRERLLGRQRVAAALRVVLDVAARRLGVQPLAHVALGGAGALGELGRASAGPRRRARGRDRAGRPSRRARCSASRRPRRRRGRRTLPASPGRCGASSIVAICLPPAVDCGSTVGRSAALASGGPPGPSSFAPWRAVQSADAARPRPRAAGARRRARRRPPEPQRASSSLAGEAGIGKTTLLEDAAERARRPGCASCGRAGSSRRRACRSPGCSSCCAPRSAPSNGSRSRSGRRSKARSRCGPATAQDRFAVGAATLSLLAAHAEECAGRRARRRRALARRIERRRAAVRDAPADRRSDRRHRRRARGRAVVRRRRAASRRCTSAGSTATRPRAARRATRRRRPPLRAPPRAIRSRCSSSRRKRARLAELPSTRRRRSSAASRAGSCAARERCPRRRAARCCSPRPSDTGDLPLLERPARAVSMTSSRPRRRASSRFATAASSSATHSRARRSTVPRRPRSGARRTGRSRARCRTATSTAVPGISRSRRSARTTTAVVCARAGRRARLRAQRVRGGGRRVRARGRARRRRAGAAALQRGRRGLARRPAPTARSRSSTTRAPRATTVRLTLASSTCAARSRRAAARSRRRGRCSCRRRARGRPRSRSRRRDARRGDVAVVLRRRRARRCCGQPARATELAARLGGRAAIFAGLAHGMALVFAGEGEQRRAFDPSSRRAARGIRRAPRRPAPRRLGRARAALAARGRGGTRPLRACARARPQPRGARRDARAARPHGARLGDDGRLAVGAGRATARASRSRARPGKVSRSPSGSAASPGSRRDRDARPTAARTRPRDARRACAPAWSVHELWTLAALGDLELGLGRPEAALALRGVGRAAPVASGSRTPTSHPGPSSRDATCASGRVDDAAAAAARHERERSRQGTAVGARTGRAARAVCSRRTRSSSGRSTRRSRCTSRHRTSSRPRGRALPTAHACAAPACASGPRGAACGDRDLRRARCGAVVESRARRARGDGRDRAQARRVDARPADAAGAPDRAVAGRWPHDARGGGGDVPQPEDDRVPPAQRVPEAGRPLARGAFGVHGPAQLTDEH